MVRVHKAMPNAPGMEQSEVDTFLTSTKGPLRLGTVDAKGDPMIHPLWFYYLNERLYILSLKDNLKVRNIRGKRRVYVSIDTDAEPHKGVKGKGNAMILADIGKAVPISEKMISKYLGDPNTAMAKRILGGIRNGTEVLVEITPLYFSTWDYSKMRN
jgi:nitroimidazol reductase NimA-like FMN-containing flavoprotein (pyridoxamine 5'-phosphate oxidase superfamily)